MTIDYKKYPKNWLTQIRPTILMRDGNHCKFCGVANGQKYLVIHGKRILWTSEIEKKYWYSKPKIVVLTVAHLDHDLSSNELDNLAALCQRCHLEHDRDQHSITMRAKESPVKRFCRLIKEELEKRGGNGPEREIISAISHHYATDRTARNVLKKYIETGYQNINGIDRRHEGKIVMLGLKR